MGIGGSFKRWTGLTEIWPNKATCSSSFTGPRLDRARVLSHVIQSSPPLPPPTVMGAHVINLTALFT